MSNISLTSPIEVLKNTFAAYGAAGVEEATLEVDAEGVKGAAMDPSHVSMVTVTLPKTLFADYDVKTSTQLTVNVEEFKKLLQRFDDGEPVKVSVGDDGLLVVVGRGAKGHKLTFKTHTLEVNGGKTPVPKITHNAAVTIPRDVLLRTVEDAQIIGESVKVAVNPDFIGVTAKSERGEASAVLDKDADGVTVECAEECAASYNADYVVAFLRSQGSKNVKLSLSSKMPLKMTNLDVERVGEVTFWLAPRIEEA